MAASGYHPNGMHRAARAIARRRVAINPVKTLMKQKVTITSTPGTTKAGDKVVLQKQPDNKFDNEAIAVLVSGPVGFEPNGYVSAFYKTRKPGTVSGGRIYDCFADKIDGIVVAEGVVEVDLPEKPGQMTESEHAACYEAAVGSHGQG